MQAVVRAEYRQRLLEGTVRRSWVDDIHPTTQKDLEALPCVIGKGSQGLRSVLFEFLSQENH